MQLKRKPKQTHWYWYIGYLDLHETHVTANNSAYKNIISFLVSNLKILYYINY